MSVSACIHGRFQIFHNDHLRYLREALRCSDRLIIGITSVRGLRGPESEDHRHNPADNPLTYCERIGMIRAALRDLPEIDRTQISFSPFPIEQPGLIPEFIPKSVTCHTTIREPWNQHKTGLLRKLGYQVSVLYEDHHKDLSGTKVREMIRNDDRSWEELVPAAVSRYLREEDLLARIRESG